MLYDLSITPEQLQAAAEWALAGDNVAPVSLRQEVDGVLIVGQGDSRAGFDLDGKELS